MKSPGKTSAALTTTPVSAPCIDASTTLRAGDDEVAAEDQIGVARRDADRVNVFRRARQLDVAEHRAALLREAGHVDHAAALALEMRGHAEDRADRDDAGAADAGDDDRIGTVGQLRASLGSGDDGGLGVSPRCALRGRAPCTVTNDGQKPSTQE